MKVKTHNLTIYMDGKSIHYSNISRVAVKYFVNWYQENPDFYGYAVDGWYGPAEA